MSSSFQQGINAAKAGRMQEALDFLKDAIIEEPQNADVWVWIAAIIDDLDKQEIFLEKALEIDPNNIPAQRGMAYLQKRKQDESSVQGESLSDHTKPISPFPASGMQVRPDVTLRKSNASNHQQALPTNKPETSKSDTHSNEGFFRSLPQLTPFEVFLMGVVVVVFCIIGLLAASALFKFELPLNFLSLNQPKLASDPPYAGVFLYENGMFFDMQEHKGPPTSDSGIPTSLQQFPILVVSQIAKDKRQINLIFETGEYLPHDDFRRKNNTLLIRPESELQNGIYCLQQPQDSSAIEDSLYWCFKVSFAPPRQIIP